MYICKHRRIHIYVGQTVAHARKVINKGGWDRSTKNRPKIVQKSLVEMSGLPMGGYRLPYGPCDRVRPGGPGTSRAPRPRSSQSKPPGQPHWQYGLGPSHFSFEKSWGPKLGLR